MFRVACILMLPLGLGACASFEHQSVGRGEAAQVIGPAVRDNRTPLELAYRCYGDKLRGRLNEPLSIAVGAITDYTGKTNDVEGAAITQGGSLMIFSALAKLGDAVVVHDRFDTRVTELELAYLDKRRLGDGRVRQIDGQNVPWLPYFGGSIAKSDFFIVGGITELNYNISSGGAEFRINQVGPKARTYTMSIAADLRLVNTSSLVVESAVSVQKQLVGYEVGFETFRFLDVAGGPQLFDINLGVKSQEPLQLGVRATLEAAVLDLLSDLTSVPNVSCLPAAWRLPDDEELARADAAAPRPQQTTAAAADATPKAAAAPAAAQNASAIAPSTEPSVPAAGEAVASPAAEEAPSPAAEEGEGPLVLVKRAEFGVHKGYVRLVLQTDGPVGYVVDETDDGVVVRLPGVWMEAPSPLAPERSRLLAGARFEQNGRTLLIHLDGRQPLKKLRTLEMSSANGLRRLVVDVAARSASVASARPRPPQRAVAATRAVEEQVAASLTAPAEDEDAAAEAPAAPSVAQPPSTVAGQPDAAPPADTEQAASDAVGPASPQKPALAGAPKISLFD